MQSRAADSSTLKRGDVHVSAEGVRIGERTISAAAIRNITLEQTSAPNRIWPYLLIGLSPFAALGAFLATGGVLVGAFGGLALVVIAALLFRDDGRHEVRAHLETGDSELLYVTRRKRIADRIIASLGRSTALTDLAVDHALPNSDDQSSNN